MDPHIRVPMMIYEDIDTMKQRVQNIMYNGRQQNIVIVYPSSADSKACPSPANSKQT